MSVLLFADRGLSFLQSDKSYSRNSQAGDAALPPVVKCGLSITSKSLSLPRMKKSANARGFFHSD